jgi:hypothetical protein
MFETTEDELARMMHDFEPDWVEFFEPVYVGQQNGGFVSSVGLAPHTGDRPDKPTAESYGADAKKWWLVMRGGNAILVNESNVKYVALVRREAPQGNGEKAADSEGVAHRIENGTEHGSVSSSAAMVTDGAPLPKRRGRPPKVRVE